MDERLQKTIADALRVDRDLVTPDLGMGGVERWDSLGHLRLVLSVEQEFRVHFSAEEIPKLTSVGCIVESLKTKGLLRDET